MRTSVRLRLLRYFLGAFLIYSAVLSGSFAWLFSASHTALHHGELETRTTRIAETLSEYVTTYADNHGSGTGPGMGGGAGTGAGGRRGTGTGYGAYLNFIDDIAGTEVWVVDTELNQIVRGHGQSTLAYQDLPAGAEAVIRSAMDGKTTFTHSFDELLPTPALTVAAPILAQDGTVAGAVLLHEQVDASAQVANRTLIILFISMAAAILLAIIAAILFAHRFTTPLAKMKSAAVAVSRGDYAAKTGVKQGDEIGALAAALDEMSAKLEAAARQSEASDRQRRDFMATISHELRTPVTVIRGSMEALRDGVVTDPDQVTQYHQQVMAETILLERLVADLLELARLQNPNFTIQTGPVNLGEVAADVVRGLREVAGAKAVEVRLSADPAIPSFTGDYARLRQMLVAVVDNAIKFSPQGTAIDLRLRTLDGTVTLSVSDQGPGIPPDELPRIFDRFHTTSARQHPSGTGLGLSIAKQIADRHDITIAVTSVLGKGTTFEFTFPTRPA